MIEQTTADTTQMFISMSPITRKSVKMVAELCNGTALWIPDTTGRLEDYSAAAKALHANKAFSVVAADRLSLVALKPSSKFGVDAVVGWMQWFRSADVGWRSRELFSWPPA